VYSNIYNHRIETVLARSRYNEGRQLLKVDVKSSVIMNNKVIT